MKISELVNELEKAEREHGDIECLVEVILDDCVALMPVEEVSFEDRQGHGEKSSATFLRKYRNCLIHTFKVI